MHAKPDLRVVLKWMIYRSGSVIAAVITLGCHMGNLLDAILKHETDEIRCLVRNNPSLAAVRSPAGSLPLDVAKSTGNVRSYVALLRENCPSDSNHSVDCAKLLEQYIHTLSDDHACASCIRNRIHRVRHNDWRSITY